jgi:hypothetical protein
MSDHPVADRWVGWLKREIKADRRPQRTDAVFDMRRAGAFGRGDGIDDIGRVDAARAFFTGKDGFAAFTDIDCIFDMD